MTSATESPGLLLIECDANTLRRQGHLRLGEEIAQAAGHLSQTVGLRFRRIQLRTRGDIDFARAFASLARYPAVVLVAHGNPEGIVAAERELMAWSDVAAAIAPVGLGSLVAISCFGGLSGPTDALFRGIPSLHEIVGSPAPVTVEQARIAIVAAMTAACGLELPVEFSTLMYVMNALVTDGVLFRRTRDGGQRASPGEQALVDLFGVAAWAAMSEKPRRGGRGLARPVVPSSAGSRPSKRSA
jgi:hypothetical protein